MEHFIDFLNNAEDSYKVFGSYTYSEITCLESGSLYVESFIFKYSFHNMLDLLPHSSPMELINDWKTWIGEYDDIIQSRVEVCRTIPPSKIAEALNILKKDPDSFAEWVDSNGDSVYTQTSRLTDLDGVWLDEVMRFKYHEKLDNKKEKWR